MASALRKLHQARVYEAEGFAELAEAVVSRPERWVTTSEILATLPFGRSKLDAYSRAGEFCENEHFVVKGGTRYWNTRAMAAWMSHSDGASTRGAEEVASMKHRPPPVLPIGVRKRAK